MDNYRFEIEEMILSCFINQDRCSELDKCEYEDFILPYNHFKASRTHKLIAKAIYILQEDKKPISDITVLNFLDEKGVKYNQEEMLVLMSSLWCTFDTMIKYLDILKDLDQEQEKRNKLEGLI